MTAKEIAVKKYVVKLTAKERERLDSLIRSGKRSAQKLTKARILLKADASVEVDRVCDYCPAFQTTEGKPSHDAIKTWVGGFWRAMALAPADWHALAADERTQVIIAPFVGFIDAGEDEDFEPAADIDDRLDEAAAEIPRAILLLRKIAQLRASRPQPWHQARRTKIVATSLASAAQAKKQALLRPSLIPSAMSLPRGSHHQFAQLQQLADKPPGGSLASVTERLNVLLSIVYTGIAGPKLRIHNNFGSKMPPEQLGGGVTLGIYCDLSETGGNK